MLAVHVMASNPGSNIGTSSGSSAGDLPSLADLLRPDGSLDLTTGFNGALDPSGFKMGYAPDGSPIFQPKVPFTPAATWNALGSGLNNGVYAIAVVGANIYVGGAFTTAGGVANTNHIACWDGSTWHPLSEGLNGTVLSIAVVGRNLYIGGYFTTYADNPANYIVRWDTGAPYWYALGSGLSDAVRAVAVEGSNVYVGGDFNAGGTAG